MKNLFSSSRLGIVCKQTLPLLRGAVVSLVLNLVDCRWLSLFAADRLLRGDTWCFGERALLAKGCCVLKKCQSAIPYIYVTRKLRLRGKKMPFLFCGLVFITIFAPDLGLFHLWWLTKSRVLWTREAKNENFSTKIWWLKFLFIHLQPKPVEMPM